MCMLQLFDGTHHYLLRNLWRSFAEWLQQNKRDCQIRFVCPPSSRGIVHSIQRLCVNQCRMMQSYCFESIFYVRYFSMKTFNWIFVFITIISSLFFFCSRIPEFLALSQYPTILDAIHDKFVLCISPQFKGRQDPKSHCPTPSLYTEWILPGDGLERLTKTCMDSKLQKTLNSLCKGGGTRERDGGTSWFIQWYKSRRSNQLSALFFFFCYYFVIII